MPVRSVPTGSHCARSAGFRREVVRSRWRWPSAGSGPVRPVESAPMARHEVVSRPDISAVATRIDIDLALESSHPDRQPCARTPLRGLEETGAKPQFALCRSTSPRTYEGLLELPAPGAARSGGACFAEQRRRALNSMKSQRHQALYVDNNSSGTHNLLCAIVESGPGMCNIVLPRTDGGVTAYGSTSGPAARFPRATLTA